MFLGTPSAASLGAQAVPPVREPLLACVVASVHDGDSLRCRDGMRVRLLLIDAPELDQGPHGRAARNVLRRLAPVGDTVLLELDVARHDRYRRLLAYVWTTHQKRMLNEIMAAEGMAVALTLPPNVRRVETIRRAVADARRAKRGLWATDGFSCTPSEHRRRRC